RRPRMRPQPCKRSAVSVRRRNYPNSFRSYCLSGFPRRKNLLDQSLEAGVTAQIVEHWVNSDGINVVTLIAAIGSLQGINRPLLIAQAYKHQRETVSRDIARRCFFSQMREDFSRLVSLSGSRVCPAEERDRFRI